jgi:organic hydroperoxide reductase OsmC/OhrA
MRISAVVTNSRDSHAVTVRTGEAELSLSVPSKVSELGSGVNGGEFLMLALATCYCNDLYREAKRLGISIEGVRVEAAADFPGIGLAATNVTYIAKIQSQASTEELQRLLRETDAVAEVHNTLRAAVPVRLVHGLP